MALFPASDRERGTTPARAAHGTGDRRRLGPGVDAVGSRVWVRPAGLLLGALADAVFGDPRRGHPVAGFGRAAAAFEARCYADRRSSGALYAAVLVGGAAGLGVLAERATARRPLAGVALTGLATWAVLGGSSLAGHGATLARELLVGDLAAARTRLPSLCGRDPAALDAAR